MFHAKKKDAPLTMGNVRNTTKPWNQSIFQANIKKKMIALKTRQHEIIRNTMIQKEKNEEIMKRLSENKNRVAKIRGYCVGHHINIEKIYKHLDLSSCFFDFDVLGICFKKFSDNYSYSEGTYFLRSLKLINTHRLPKTSKKLKFLKYIFIYTFGVVINWNCTEQECLVILNNLKEFIEIPLVQFETDQIIYTEPKNLNEDDSATRSFSNANGYNDISQTLVDDYIKNEVLTLCTPSFNEKAAVSHAMAQSVKMGSFEKDVENLINENVKAIHPKGNIFQEKRYYSKKLGMLFLKKRKINFEGRLTPDPKFQKRKHYYHEEYIKVRRYFQIKKRLRLINVKIDYLRDIYETYLDEVSKKFDVRLYYIFFFVISLECLEALGELIFGMLQQENIIKLSPIRMLRQKTSECAGFVSNLILFIFSWIAYLIQAIISIIVTQNN